MTYKNDLERPDLIDTVKWPKAGEIGDPPPGCLYALLHEGPDGSIVGGSYEYVENMALIWKEVMKKNLFRYAKEAGISWIRNGKVIVIRGAGEDPFKKELARAVLSLIYADELDGDAKCMAIFQAAQSMVKTRLDPYLAKAYWKREEMKNRGKERAKKKHGQVTNGDRWEWQKVMDRVCKKPGISKSAAWAEVENEVGSKRETLERHHVVCPIPARKPRIGKSSP